MANCNAIEKISILCRGTYFDIKIKLHDGTDLNHRFHTDNQRVIMYENGVKVHRVNNPRQCVEKAVALFFFKLFSRRDLKIQLLEIDTSKLTTTVRNTVEALGCHWKPMFKEIQRAMSHLPAPVNVWRFEVDGHPLLEGIEVEAFWNCLAPGKLEVFYHKGKSTPFYRGNLDVLTGSDQWKKAKLISTKFYGGLEIDELFNLTNVIARMDNFSLDDFQQFLKMSIESHIFSTAHIMVTPSGPVPDDWKKSLKDKIVSEMKRSASGKMEDMDCFHFRMKNVEESILAKCREEPDYLSIILVTQTAYNAD